MACSGCKQMTATEKIGSILTGWKHVIWPDKETEAEALRRVEICSGCESSKNTLCKQCGCWIPAKARSMQEGCPINKW